MNDILSQFHDWQIWVPIGVAFVIFVPGLLLISVACNSSGKKKPEGQDNPQKLEREDNLLASGIGCLALLVWLFVSSAAGIWVVNQMGPNYFSEEKPCVSCGVSVLKSDEYCSECGIEQIEQIEQVSTCPNCGEVIRDVDKFCSSCGTRTENQAGTQPETQPAPTIPTCPTCKVPCDTPYCPSCGTQIPQE